MNCLRINYNERIPLYGLLDQGILYPPKWAKYISWHCLTEHERSWFEKKYSSVEDIIQAQCCEWELNILRKLQTERDAEIFYINRLHDQ